MKKTASSRSTAPKASAPAAEKAPGFRNLVFAKNCTNAHGTFAKGDTARGAFAPELVESYLKTGILVRRA